MKKQLNKLLAICAIVFFNSNGARSQWVSLSLPGKQNFVQSFAINNDVLFMGVNSSGIYVSKDNGSNWELNTNGIVKTNFSIPSIVSFENKVYAIINDNTSSSIYESTDNENWHLCMNGLPTGLFTGEENSLNKLFSDQNNLYASSPIGLYVKRRTSKEWIKSNFPVQKVTAEVRTVLEKGEAVFVTTTQDGIFSSEGNGEEWTRTKSIGLPIVNNGNSITVNHLATTKNYLLAGTESGLFVSYDQGDNWSILKDGAVRSLVIVKPRIYVGQLDNKVFYSDDNGLSWQNFDSGLELIATMFAFSENDLFAINNGNGIYRYSDVTAGEKKNSIDAQIQFHVYPNPSGALSHISFNLEGDNDVELKIYDVNGRKVFEQTSQSYLKGPHTIEWNTKESKNGMYCIYLKEGNKVVSKNIIVNH